MDNLNNRTTRIYLIANFICDICNFKLYGYELAQIADISFSDVEKLPFSAESREVFQRSAENVEIRSSVFAQYVIHKVSDNDIILKMFKKSLMLNADKYHLLIKK